MRAIPIRLLIHSCEVMSEASADDWSDSTFEPLGSFEHVRIEPSSRVVRDKNNCEMQLAANMFYDCKNSIGNADHLKEDNIVKFNNDLYRIVSVEPLYDAARLHHYELGMIRYGL